MAPRLTISAVVPTLNEQVRLPQLLARLCWMPLEEVVVVDGGSVDDTVAIARGAGATVVEAPRGRGRQLRLGACHATGDVLWFLHADALPPAGAVGHIRRALRHPEVVGGAFTLHTVPDGGPLSLGGWLRIADLRSRLTRRPYGDQGLFVRREIYEAVGGYPDTALLEDLALSSALRRVGRLVTVRDDMRVSGRRFEHAPVRSLVLMNVLPTLWRLGVHEDTLARWYRDYR